MPSAILSGRLDLFRYMDSFVTFAGALNALFWFAMIPRVSLLPLAHDSVALLLYPTFDTFDPVPSVPQASLVFKRYLIVTHSTKACLRDQHERI